MSTGAKPSEAARPASKVASFSSLKNSTTAARLMAAMPPMSHRPRGPRSAPPTSKRLKGA